MRFLILVFCITLICFSTGCGRVAWASESTDNTQAKEEASPSSSPKKAKGRLAERLDAVVVTGSKRKRTLSNSPVKTELVQKEVIENNHLSDLSQVLDNVPGITLQNLTGRLGRAPVIQGLSDEQVLVLIDGVPQLQISSSGYDLTQLSVNDIESVEVIKGGASSLYGSQAMGGVINVITKKPKDKTEYFLDFKNVYNPTEQIESMRALPNVMNANLSGLAKNLFNYKLSFGHRRQEAMDLDESSLAQDMGATQRYNASVYLTRKILDRQNLFIDYRFIDEKLGLTLTQPTSAGYVPIVNESSTQTQSATLGHNWQLGSTGNLKSSAFYSQVRDDLKLNDAPSTSYNENEKVADLNTVIIESQYDDSFIKDQYTTMGLQYRYQFLDQENFTQNSSGASQNTEVDQRTLWSLESYAQHSMTWKDLEITPGVRGQYDSDFGTQATPSLNMIYSPKWFKNLKSNIRSSVSSGYRIPSLKERFFLMDHRDIAGYIIEGSDGLSPERSINYQLGLELIRSQKYSFHINGFLNQVRDMIGVVQNTDASGTMIFRYENLTEALTRGIEISTMYTPWSSFTLEQDLTLLKADNVSQNYEIPLRPRTVYKLRAYYQATKDLMLTTLFRYQSDEYVNTANTDISPSYSVLDLKMNYKYDRQLNLYAGVENIFNETRHPAQDGQLMSFDNRPILGRQFYIGLNYRNL